MGDLNDLIYAYSLGCLDPEEQHEVINCLNNGEEFNLKELGEYQNLVSLLPLTLTIEIPDPQLKENVARKLYSLKDDIRAKREKSQSSPENQDTKVKVNEFNDDADIQDDRQVGLEFEDDSPKALYHFPPVSHKNKYNLKFIWALIFFILIATIILSYYYISSETKNLNTKVETLKKEVNQLNNQLSSSQELQAILLSPNIQIINLKGTSLNPAGFGKLFIDSAKETMYLQISQMSTISEDSSLQLWVSISGKFSNLGNLSTPDNKGFYSFKMPDLGKNKEISFLITEGSISESTTPGNQVYLIGTLTP
jgi:cell division protein FtsL